MKKGKIKIGLVSLCQDRRCKFSDENVRLVVEQKAILLKQLEKYEDIEIVDINDVSPADAVSPMGITDQMSDVDPIVRKFQAHAIDGIFIHHADFGSEFVAAKIAGQFDVPVILWGSPQDEIKNGKLGLERYSQVGIYGTGKILRRYGRPFDYMVSCLPDSKEFDRFFRNFIAVCAVMRAFHTMRIMQISTRPHHFWTVKTNEAQLLENFKIEVFPVGMGDLVADILRTEEKEKDRIEETIKRITGKAKCCVSIPEQFRRVAALQIVLEDYFEKYDISGAAMQCWDQLSDMTGIVPCSTFGMLTDEYKPITCETDIMGAIGSVLLQEAGMHTTPTFFTDICVPHPDNRNAGLLWHCGCFPPSIALRGEGITDHPTNPGVHACIGNWELQHSPITLTRFDEEKGKYHLLIARGKGVEGPKVTGGTYVWMEVKDGWRKFENRMANGPYIHHISGILKDVAPVMYSAAKYMPNVETELFSVTEDEINNYLWCLDD